MEETMTDQQQAIDQQIEHERAARVKAADAISALFGWAVLTEKSVLVVTIDVAGDDRYASGR